VWPEPGCKSFFLLLANVKPLHFECMSIWRKLVLLTDVLNCLFQWGGFWFLQWSDDSSKGKTFERQVRLWSVHIPSILRWVRWDRRLRGILTWHMAYIYEWTKPQGMGLRKDSCTLQLHHLCARRKMTKMCIDRLVRSMGYWPSGRSRWLDIGQVLFLRVYGLRRSQGP